MTINTQQLIELAVELCRIHELRVTTKECVKGSVIAGLSTFLGGVIFGPIGLAVGELHFLYFHTINFRL